MTNGERFLLLDSCVVIDFIKADDELFSLVSQFVGDVFVADAMFPEIQRYFKVETPGQLGLRIASVDLDDVIDAARRSEGSRLSANDCICLLTARRHGWTCVTNDSRLCRECERENVAFWRGLRLVVELFRAGGVDYERACQIGRRVRETNKWLTDDIMNEFFKMLDGC